MPALTKALANNHSRRVLKGARRFAFLIKARELRDHVFGADGNLYVANAFKEKSQKVRFRGIRNNEGKHAFRDISIRNDAVTNPDFSHPFNIAFDPRGDVLVSSQNSSLALRYHSPKSDAGVAGSPMPVAPVLARVKGRKFMPGTFCASAKDVADGLVVVRKAIFASGLLLVADRDADCVRKYDPGSGAFLGEISAPAMIDKPIHFLADDGVIYVGNRGNESVVKCYLRSGQVSPFIHPKAGGLSNSSGLAFGNDGYFSVGSRGTHQILRYRLADGRPDKRLFIDDLEDEPEFISLVGLQ